MKRKAKQQAPVATAAHWVNVESVQAYAKAEAATYNASCEALKVSIKRQFLNIMRECFDAGARIMAVEFVTTFLATLEGQAKVNVNVATAYARRIASGLSSGYEPTEGEHKDCAGILAHSDDIQKVAECFPKVTNAGAPKAEAKVAAPKAEAKVATAPVTLELVSAWIRERATSADRAACMDLIVGLTIAKVTTAEARVALESARKVISKIAA